MATVNFTSHLHGYTPCDPADVEATTVAAALRQALDGNEKLRSYLFDEQGLLRRHMVVFVDGKIVADRVGLSDPIGPTSQVYVMQALSGG